MTLQRWLVDTGERTLSTIVQTAIVYWLAASTIDAGFWTGLAAAVVAGAFNIIKAALTAWIPKSAVWWHDMAIRTLWTFLISIAGSLASVHWFELIDAGWWKTVILAAFSAALAVIKATLARLRPGTITPASLALAA